MRENFNLDNISLESIRQEEVIKTLHEKFENQKKIYQPNPKDFFNEPGFDPVEIQKEIDLAASLKGKWQQSNSPEQIRNKEVSDIFEGIIVDEFCGDWLANQAEAFYTAEPDDYIRKIDCVIEFKPEEGLEKREYLGLGVDVTFSSDFETVKKKLDDIWLHDVAHKKQVKVKYVDTENFKGSLNVCRAVLVADKETVHELARLYKNKDQEAINKHPFLANIILQLKYQLEAYFNEAQQNSAPGSYLRAVTKTLSTFYRVYSEKEEFVSEHVDSVLLSTTFQSIKSYCDAKLNN